MVTLAVFVFLDPSLSQRVVLDSFLPVLYSVGWSDRACQFCDGIDQFNDEWSSMMFSFSRLPYFQLSGSADSVGREVFDIHAELG